MDTEKRPHGEDGHVRTEAEIEVMHLQAKEHKCQKLEETRKDPPLESAEGAWPCQQLDLELLASWTVRDYISVVSSNPLCGALLL